jgi:hypothetical protein
VSLKKYKSQGKAAEVTVNGKEEKSKEFCLDFVKEFGLCLRSLDEQTLLLRMCALCSVPSSCGCLSCNGLPPSSSLHTSYAAEDQPLSALHTIQVMFMYFLFFAS